MGKVFSLEEVKLGQIPGAQDFQHIAQVLRAEMGASPAFLGGLILGSVLRGDATPRSDLDCLVLYKVEHHNEAFAVMQMVAKEASRLFVPLEIIPLDTEMARTNMHDLECSFLRHLKWAANNGGIIKENPLPHILSDDLDPFQDSSTYICLKERKLRKALASWTVLEEARNERYYATLEAVLHDSIYATRKLLHWKGVLGVEDGKRQVVEMYREHFPSYLSELLERLYEADSRYTSLVNRQMSLVQSDEYEKHLRSIAALIPTAKEFLRGNLFLLAQAQAG